MRGQRRSVACGSEHLPIDDAPVQWEPAQNRSRLLYFTARPSQNSLHAQARPLRQYSNSLNVMIEIAAQIITVTITITINHYRLIEACELVILSGLTD